MTCRVDTTDLINLLTDLLATADMAAEAGAVGSVLLHTTRAQLGAEPGRTDILAGLSTDRSVAGHTYVQCTGQLAAPMLWPVRDAQSAIAVFKASAKRDEHHAVEIHRDGPLITISEDANLFDDGLSLTFAAGDPSAYPGPRIYRTLMKPTRDIIELGTDPIKVAHALPRTDIRQTALVAFSKVSKRRGMPVELYRTHQNEPVHVQIGHAYRGLLMPLEYHADGDERSPAAEVHAPDLAELERLMADAVATKNGGAPRAQTEPLFSTTSGS